MPSIARALCLTVLALGGLASGVHAQAPLENTPIPMWVPDGAVTDVVKVGNTIVVGGEFRYVGPPSGTFVIGDTADASAFNTTAQLADAVIDIVSDGSGGWYVASEVSNQARPSSVIHVLADGRPDPRFSYPLLSRLNALALEAGRLFVGGTFTTSTGGHTGLTALDAVTGAVLPWDPSVIPGTVIDLVASAGVLYSTSYVGGAGFQTSGRAIDAATGAALPFPALQDGGVAAVAGGRVYVATQTNSTSTINAHASDGTPLVSWTSTPYTSVLAGSVAASSSHVYAIVQTGNALTAPRQLVALDGTTGALVWTAPAFDNGAGFPVQLAVDGNMLFVVGGFARVGSDSRRNIAAFDATTGALLPWAPSISGPIVTKVVAANGKVAIGNVNSVNGIVKRGLVSLDLTSGRPTAVQPPDTDSVAALTASGDLVVVATAFYPTGAREVFAYSAATGARYPTALPTNGDVTSMAIDGGTLFVAGFFSTLDDQLRRNLAAYDLAAGQLLPWNPSPDGGVRKIKLHAGALYAVGPFKSLTGYGRNSAVAFDRGSLEVTSWQPQPGGIAIYDLDAWQDRVFLGLHLRDEPTGPLSGRPVMQTLAVNRFSGGPLNIALPFGPDVAVVAGVVVAAGDGQPTVLRHPVVSVDASTGQARPWNPEIVSFATASASLPPNVKVIGLDGYLVVTRTFSVGGRPVSGLAVFRPQIVLPGAPRQIQMTAAGSTVSLAWSAGGSPAPLGYVIEAGSAPGLADLGRFPVGLATQVAAGVAPGSYALRVRAIGAAGEGPPSSEWLVTTPATATPPAAPSGLVGSVIGNVVSLGWTAAAGNATTYVIEGGSAPGLSNLGVLPTGSLDTAIAGAVPPGTYYFRMRAANPFGSSPPSNEILLVVP